MVTCRSPAQDTQDTVQNPILVTPVWWSVLVDGTMCPSVRRTARGRTSHAALSTSRASRSRCRGYAPGYPATAPWTPRAASAPSSALWAHRSALPARWMARGTRTQRATAIHVRRKTDAIPARGRWVLRVIGPPRAAPRPVGKRVAAAAAELRATVTRLPVPLRASLVIATQPAAEVKRRLPFRQQHRPRATAGQQRPPSTTGIADRHNSTHQRLSMHRLAVKLQAEETHRAVTAAVPVMCSRPVLMFVRGSPPGCTEPAWRGAPSAVRTESRPQRSCTE